LQLSFAIKLWHYTKLCKIEKEIFDDSLIIQDPSNCVSLNESEFQTYNDLILASENNVSICFGSATITLWEAIREKTNFNTKSIDPKNGIKQSLASLSYMIRCCFAHSMAVPVWSIRNNKYKVKYPVGNKIVDLTNIKNGQPFDYPSIGGYETLWWLKDVALKNGLI